MSFFDTLILSTVLILFPMICILIIKANLNNSDKVSKEYYIDIANLIVLVLLLKYCSGNSYVLFLINMPFIISLLYHRKISSIIISVILVIINYYMGLNAFFVIGEYFLYLLLFVFLYNRPISINTLLISFVCIKGVFLTIYEYYILKKDTILTLFEIFICLVIFYLIGLLLIYIINLIDKTVNLNQSLKQLEKEKNLKNSLFKISHELKNPIAVCKGYLQMMDYEDIDKVKKYNNIVLNELNRTLDIMDNFSQYNKISIKLDIMDFDYLITDTINSMYSVFKSKNISVNYKGVEEVYIDGDYLRLKQVLINLLKNSTEALDDGGIIDIKLLCFSKNLELRIKDNGCGMSDDEIRKISELFYSTKDKGCGIGVSLSKEIISLHHGSLKYNSKKDKYTEAIIRIPLHQKV